MAIKKISLDKKEIQKAINDLKSIQKDISSTLPSNIESILDEAVEYCKSITPIGDGDKHLVDNTYWEKTSTGYRIVQEGDNVAFVEFGTGVVGEASPHVGAGQFGWQYAVGSSIFVTKNGRIGWVYPTNDSGTSFKFTEGQKANMQMYRTKIWLEEKLNQELSLTMKRVSSKWSQ